MDVDKKKRNFLNKHQNQKFTLKIKMGLGTFCTTKNHKLETIQPNNLRITGIQSGFLQYLEIYQSIQTTEDLDEVSYIFPTDNKICVYGMTFHVGDETIEAELRSNKIADQTFKEAKRTGRTAAITKEESPGITSIPKRSIK